MTHPDTEYDLVLVGGGHSHALVLRMLAMNPILRVRLTLISPDSLTAYSGMLPGLIAGHYSLQDTHIDLARLCLASHCRFIRARVCHIDRQQRQLTLDNGASVAYDWLSLDVGAVPAPAPLANSDRQRLVAVKPVADFYQRWLQLVAELQQQQARPDAHRPRLAVVGGGAGGCEIALAVAHTLQQRQLAGRVSLHTAGELLAGFSPAVRQAMAGHLQALDIQLHQHQRITEISAGQLHSQDDNNNHSEAVDLVLWCTGVRGLPFLADSGLECDTHGFVRVEPSLQTRSDPRIFAAGDCAALPVSTPKAGVYAVRQAKILARNLAAAIHGQTLKAYRPQRRFLSLLSAGDRQAVASRPGLLDRWAPSGPHIWRWKDRIDRAFMARFAELPSARAMPMASSGETLHCTGCGAKLGSEILREALKSLQPVVNSGIEAGIDQADDAAVIRWPEGQRLVQSLDYFPAFVDEPWLFARIAVLHSLSDLYAMNATPHSALANVTIPWQHPRLQQRDLQRLMAGALLELNQANCSLVGGHTLAGPQLAAGFTVNGAAPAEQLWHKGGARPGDQLILSKPLGTGIQLASMMHGKARGPWLESCFDSMLISNRLAQQAMQPFTPHACTDITGFGLLGHLIELCQQSQLQAELNLAALPLLPGTTELLKAGVRSTLSPANEQALSLCSGSIDEQDPRLLAACDPQTNGGLLFAVAAEHSDAALQALRDQHQQACVIGKVDVKLSANATAIQLR